MGETILFAEIPKLDDLYCMTAVIDLNERKDPSVKSNFQWQILKCRILIFSNSDVIASPVVGSLQHIYVIIDKMNYMNGVFHKMAEAVNLKYSKPQLVTSGIFEACLRYSLTARLAPNWNQVGNFLIKGRDFLMCSKKLTSINLNIKVAVNEVSLVIKVCSVNLPKVGMEDILDEVDSGRQYFQNVPYDLSHHQKWVYVLPSLKRGRVMAVSTSIPKFSPFNDYKELKRHWKNTYGYRLPDSEEGMVYLAITFFGNNQFTYPISCVRSCHPIVINRDNHMSTIRQFVGDLNQNFPKLCGIPFIVDLKISYTDLKLISLHHEPVGCHPTTTAVHIGKRYQTLEELVERNETRQQERTTTVHWHHTRSPRTPMQTSYKFNFSKNESGNNDLNNCNDDVKSQAVSLYTPSTDSQYSLNEDSIPPSMIKVKPQPLVPTFTTSKKDTKVKIPVFVQKEVNIEDGVKNATSKKDKNPPHRPIFSKPIMTKVLKSMFTCFKDNNLTSKMPVKKNSLPIAEGKQAVQQTTSNYESVLNPCMEGENVLKRVGTAISLNPEKPKKQCIRPKVKEIDVELLARNGSLTKANAPTLIAYLKEKGIACKTRDKKTDLMNKVFTHLDLPLPKHTIV